MHSDSDVNSEILYFYIFLSVLKCTFYICHSLKLGEKVLLYAFL